MRDQAHNFEVVLLKGVETPLIVKVMKRYLGGYTNYP